MSDMPAGPDVTGKSEESKPQRRSIWLAALPIVFFAALAGLFTYSLQTGDPSRLPSVLINKPSPEFDLPKLDGLMRNGRQLPGIKTPDLKAGKVHVLNFWASWCTGCREEHPVLEAFHKMKIAPLVGIDYKDAPSNALRFLGQYGNPYDIVGVDRKGRTGIDWGVYGIPETFIVDGEGIVRYKHIGPISPRDLKEIIIPEIEKARTTKAQKAR